MRLRNGRSHTPALHRSRRRRCHVDIAIQFDDADRPEHAHIRDTGDRQRLLQAAAQPELDAAHLPRPARLRQQVERGQGHCARQRVTHEGGAVHEPAPVPL